MTTLAIDKVRRFAAGAGEFFNEIPIEAAETIFEGAAVGDNGSGFAQPLVAGDVFRGFAFRQVENETGAAGDLDVKVRTRGEVELTVVGVVDDDDIGETVFASDDDTFTLSSTGNSSIGKVTQHVSGTTAVVYFEAQQVQSL